MTKTFSCDSFSSSAFMNQLAKIACGTVSLFVLSWVSYAVFCVAGVHGRGDLVTPYTAQIPVLVAKASATWNPVVYALTHPKFRSVCFALRFPFPTFCREFFSPRHWILTFMAVQSCSGEEGPMAAVLQGKKYRKSRRHGEHESCTGDTDGHSGKNRSVLKEIVSFSSIAISLRVDVCVCVCPCGFKTNLWNTIAIELTLTIICFLHCRTQSGGGTKFCYVGTQWFGCCGDKPNRKRNLGQKRFVLTTWVVLRP